MVRSDAGERSVGPKNVSFLKRTKTYFSRLKAYCMDTDQSYCNIISRDLPIANTDNCRTDILI
jgi:hypothetical protein